MQSENKTKMSSLLNLDVLASFVATVGLLVKFGSTISQQYAGFDLSVGITRGAYLMVAITFIALLLLCVYGGALNRGGLFIWLPVFFVVFAFLSTVLSGLYTTERLPFRFIEMFYWVSVMILAYYSVGSLNTPKFHVAIVVLILPFLAYMFFVTREAESAYSDTLVLNPVYFISYLMPVILLLRSKLLKVGFLLLIFAVVILSYKRMAIVAYLMSLLVYFYYLSKTSPDAGRWKKVTIIMGIVMFIAVLAFTFQRLSGVFGLDWSGRMGTLSESGGSGRLTIWREVLAAFAEQPGYWLIGHGHESLQLTMKIWAHNDILEVLYDFGAIGLALYLLFIAKLVRIFFEMKRLRYKHVDAFAVSLVWWAFGSMFSILVTLPHWFLGMSLFWGITVADFENFKSQAPLLEMEESLYIDPYDDKSAASAPYA